MFGREICRWVDTAYREAQKSDHKQKMAAVIFNKSKFISCGHNYTCRSINSHLSKFRRWPTSLHAEVISVINARTGVKGCSILVIRVNNNGELRFAMPCSKCMEYLKYVGIKKVYYSLSHYPYIEMIKI